MARRAKYPRINCSVSGCKRGTTTFEPGSTMICGKCWRKAPKRLRDRYSFWRRKAKLLDKRGDPRASGCWYRMSGQWHAILDMLNGNDLPAEDELPALLAEELRKLALL